LSDGHPFEVKREFFDDLSEIAYDSEGEVAWTKHLYDFLAFMDNVEGFNEIEVCILLAHTLRQYPLLLCCMLPPNCMHSFTQFSDLMESGFHDFDPKSIDKKMLKQWYAPHASLIDFW